MIINHSSLAPLLIFLFLIILKKAKIPSKTHKNRNIKPKVPPMVDVIRYMAEMFKSIISGYFLTNLLTPHGIIQAFLK